ncbi:MAG: hypothetical protein Q8R18_05675 [bacterium]|nr:hypothetical protein [bacterium]
MGLFDSIILKELCPYCGKKSEMEFQTKDLRNCLDVFEKGDSISTLKFHFLESIGACSQEPCRIRAIKRELMYRKEASSFGEAIFHADIEINKGIITGKVKNVQISEEYTDPWLNKKENKIKWEKEIGKYALKPKIDSSLLNELKQRKSLQK